MKGGRPGLYRAAISKSPAPSSRPLWFAGLEGVENLGADGPRPSAPGTLRRRRSRSQRFNDRRFGIWIDRDAVLAHALIVFLQPGRQREPQIALGLTAGGIGRR